jgi:hypothetical protein
VAVNVKQGEKWVPKVSPRLEKVEEFRRSLEERHRIFIEEDENRLRRRERQMAEFNARLAEIPSHQIWA